MKKGLKYYFKKLLVGWKNLTVYLEIIRSTISWSCLAMTSDIIISIRLEMADLIRLREKNYEFRRYKLPPESRRVWIYVTRPVSELKYVAEIGNVVEYPTIIPENGIGNAEFNKGLKKSKNAYPILHLDELVPSIGLYQLRKESRFFPPQKFAYVDNYPKLAEYISNSDLRRLY